jgi:hypothetical protein
MIAVAYITFWKQALQDNDSRPFNPRENTAFDLFGWPSHGEGAIQASGR